MCVAGDVKTGERGQMEEGPDATEETNGNITDHRITSLQSRSVGFSFDLGRMRTINLWHNIFSSDLEYIIQWSVNLTRLSE